MTGYYARCFSFLSSFTIVCGFELFEIFKDPKFEADLPSSAPVYVLFWLDGLSLFDFLGMSVSLGFVPIWVRKKIADSVQISIQRRMFSVY